MHRRFALTAALALSLSLPGSVVWAQGVALPALSSRRVLMLGQSTTLPAEAAQVRFTFDGAFVTGLYDADRSRQSLDDTPRVLGMTWDAAFDLNGVGEIGGRLRFAWDKSDTSERLGPDLLGIGGRYQAIGPQQDERDGLRLALGFALGQRLREGGGRLIEADVVVGAPLGGRASWEAEAAGLLTLEGPEDARHVSVTTGPEWRPTDWLSLVVDAQGRYGRLDAGLADFWELTAAVRFGFELGRGHELALSGWRTLYGQSIEERTAGLLTWRVRWMTDGGLLRLDTDEPVLPESLAPEGASEPAGDEPAGDEPDAPEPPDAGDGD